MPSKRDVLAGERFGRWTVLDPEHHLGTDGWRAHVRAAECACDCGTVRLVRLSTLTDGRSVSCGCFHREQSRAWGSVPEHIAPMLAARPARPADVQNAASAARFRSPEHRALVSAATTTHGLSRHPLYGTWRKMHVRCENPQSKDYPNYGGAGHQRLRSVAGRGGVRHLG